jgi:hypothetical protein
MRNILFLALLALFAGCSRQWCATRYPPSIDTVRVSVTRDTIIYRDTIIFLEVPGETIIDSVIIPCPPPQASFVPDTARAETAFAMAKAWWSYPVIRLDLTQKDTAVLLKAALRESRHWESLLEKVTKIPQPVKYVPTFYKVCLWLWIGVLIAIGGYVGFKFLKK